MLNSKNSFEAVVKNDLTTLQKNKLFRQAKMYILWQQLQELMEKELHVGEEILHAMPMTNENNSQVFTSGLMGMSYARTPLARSYVETFYDIRGNRLLLFTNERLIFFVVLDYLESGKYYTYSYEKIENIYLKRFKISAFSLRSSDPQVMAVAKQGEDHYYLLDFEADGHYLEEIFPPKDAEKLLEIFGEIPQLKDKVNAHKKIYRKRKWDRVFANPFAALRLAQVMNLGWILLFLFIVFLVICAIFDTGPAFLKDLISYWQSFMGK